MTTLIIARHGNTFSDNDTLTYVGGRTDLPLVQKGREQAREIGKYLKRNNLVPDVVYASHLQRTLDTARIAIKETGITNPVYPLDIFNEIDYGPDENKTKEEVLARIGEQAHKDWETENILPHGWLLDAETIIQNWKNFVDHIRAHDDNETILVVTSNGIARFAPHITEDFEGFKATHPLKLATGALSIFTYENGAWVLKAWNVRP